MTLRRAFWPTISITAATLALAGCDGPTANSPPSSALVAVPASVQAMMDAEFPSDGEIHLQSSGAFAIKEGTEFCHTEGRVSANLKEVAPRFDLTPGLDGMQNAPLNRRWGGKTCKNDGKNLVSDWALANNRSGEPYKLVLAVWQGDPAKGGALWVGGVKRLPGNLHPSAGAILSFEGEKISIFEKINASVKSDVDELSNAFVTEFGRMQTGAI